MKRLGFYFLLSSFVLSLFTGVSAPKSADAAETAKPGKILGDYAGVVRETTPRSDGIYHIDTPRSIEKMKELHINTYYYLIWDENTDWDDLRNEFLPAAKKAGIDVVVYVVPPTESTGERKSYPYTTDYLAWSREIAKLSIQYPNVIGWAIDDFNHNLNKFTPEYMDQMKKTSEAINPDLFFSPLMYTDSLNESFLQTRGAYIDGVILAFRDGIYRNTQVYASEQEQIDSAYSLLSKYNLPLYWMIYASQLSKTPANPSADYVRKVTQIALENMKKGKIEGTISYVLKKNFEPEPTDDKAYDDTGYLNFFIGSGVPSSAGNYAQATQRVRVNKADNYSLTFQTMNLGADVSGYHKKQLLIDGKVVWEQDTAEIVPDLLWKPVTVDLKPYLAGKSWADVSFRFYENKGVNNFWTYAGFDALQPVGFTVNNANFADNSSWNVSSNYSGIIGEILQYDEQRRERAYNHIKVSYATYELYSSIYTSNVEAATKSSLLKKAADIMTYHFEEQNDRAIQGLNSLQNQIASLKGKEISDDQAETWDALIKELKEYYSAV
ncbi:hypothetical protein LCY76_06445 [Fictibacillus sp. KIGAM418]|uniref:Uncharacterized protein n=1 Tax=Fictibacillus marinisediminis TaxID=2878389 RepID=A0A9X1XBB2_9BACL|nr:hypothetical protein [Fictibacillus marinisediminis]MCK6256238.1 hypothetical protein [Fictibacillus marinisediminis]